MGDPDTSDQLIRAATHVAAGGGGAGLVAWLSRLFQAKEAQEVSTRLALIEQALTNIASDLKKHEGLGERLALAEQALKALHSRMDSYDAAGRRSKR